MSLFHLKLIADENNLQSSMPWIMVVIGASRDFQSESGSTLSGS
jgi:hypothetical protein